VGGIIRRKNVLKRKFPPPQKKRKEEKSTEFFYAKPQFGEGVGGRERGWLKLSGDCNMKARGQAFCFFVLAAWSTGMGCCWISSLSGLLCAQKRPLGAGWLLMKLS
jgi:hypothetical protein